MAIPAYPDVSSIYCRICLHAKQSNASYKTGRSYRRTFCPKSPFFSAHFFFFFPHFPFFAPNIGILLISVPDIFPCVKFPTVGNISCFSCFSCFIEKKKEETLERLFDKNGLNAPAYNFRFSTFEASSSGHRVGAPRATFTTAAHLYTLHLEA